MSPFIKQSPSTLVLTPQLQEKSSLEVESVGLSSFPLIQDMTSSSSTLTENDKTPTKEDKDLGPASYQCRIPV